MSNILYHYCSTAAFQSIVESHSIRLSALSLSNDSQEGKLVRNTFAGFAARDGLDRNASHDIQSMVASLENFYEGFGFCLSEEPDLLSQWRGYADNATGVAIGFSREYLEWLGKNPLDSEAKGFNVVPVKYDPKQHEAEVESQYIKVKKRIEDGALKQSPGHNKLNDRLSEAKLLNPTGFNMQEFVDKLEREKEANREKDYEFRYAFFSGLYEKLFCLKSPGFKEEKEWRLLETTDLHDSKGLKYRSIAGQIIPFKEYTLRESGHRAILKVILGPKHLTPVKVVEKFLDQNGFGFAHVDRSVVSYR